LGNFGMWAHIPPWSSWPSWIVCVTNDHGYVPFVVITIRFFPHWWLITGFEKRVARWVPHVEQELPTIPNHPCFSGVRVARSLVFWVKVCRSLFVLLFFFFQPLFFMSFFDLSLWYLQTFINTCNSLSLSTHK
jgi:hypothetical protein